MNNLGDAIAWPTRDREWITKVIVIGLIYLIPIVGAIVLLGWMLASLGVLVFLTIAYGHAVAAAVIRRFELDLAPPAPTQVPAPPAPH